MDAIQYVISGAQKGVNERSALFSPAEAARVRAFHASFPQYAQTPLRKLDGRAKELGLRSIAVKDESYRFGLNAFKVLGSSYAIARYIAHRLDLAIEACDYFYMTGRECKALLGKTTFFTATDGNHGRGVAWSARMLGLKAVVRMPRGTSLSRLENIRKEGATVTIEDMEYDDCVRLAAAQASACPGGVIVQDTAWPGYERIPQWIMQGYATMADEAAEQLVERPTHVFVQAGVGSMAAAVQAYFDERYPAKPPKVIVIEAAKADCLRVSAQRGDGELRAAPGPLDSMMAGLNCGEANPLAWDILRGRSAAFVSCPDWVSAQGMRLLARPIEGDERVISGESGAVGMGLIWALTTLPQYAVLRDALRLDERSSVLLFSTEGATDPVNYKKIVGFEP